MKRPPKNYLVQIDDNRLAEVIYYWNYHYKPCSMLFMKPKTEGLAAYLLQLIVMTRLTFSFGSSRKQGVKFMKLIIIISQ